MSHSPAAWTFFTQSTSGPYVMMKTCWSFRRKTLTGVRYMRPDVRPRCLTTANPGRRPAKGAVRRFVTFLLNEATAIGIGMTQPPGDSDHGRIPVDLVASSIDRR